MRLSSPQQLPVHARLTTPRLVLIPISTPNQEDHTHSHKSLAQETESARAWMSEAHGHTVFASNLAWVFSEPGKTRTEYAGVVEVSGIEAFRPDNDPLDEETRQSCATLHADVSDCLQLRIVTAPGHIGKGFSFEAVKAVLRHLFASTTATRVESAVQTQHPHRKCAEALLERIGFVKDRNLKAGNGTVWVIERNAFAELWTS
ncbi:hypothetical protein HDU98_011229 [Podochytrium sp. JEL0797]|nr:hypothetical protein HDU98_011229 [Podochytrium sp. JEL0797]